MKFHELPLTGAYLVEPSPIVDERGWFTRLFCSKLFEEAGLKSTFLQVNQARTESAGIIRGLHYQLPPSAETKLVRCTQGVIFDVIVDVRRGSPTFLSWHGETLSDHNQKMLYAPKGFAHGYQAITDTVEVTYQSSAAYDPEREQRIRFDDPRLGIVWPHESCSVSPKDASTPPLSDSFQGIDIL